MATRPSFLRDRRWLFALLPILAGVTAGCGGNVRCHFVSQNMNSIRVEPTDAKSARLDAKECYWWVDEKGQLHLAGQGKQKSLLNPQSDREFAIVFSPGEPSQGVGKDYRLTRSRVRGYIKMGGNTYRFESIYGLLGTENREKERLVAAYRCNVNLEGAKLLGGWSDPVVFMIFGTLEATRDREGRGKAIQSQIADDAFCQ